MDTPDDIFTATLMPFDDGWTDILEDPFLDTVTYESTSESVAQQLEPLPLLTGPQDYFTGIETCLWPTHHPQEPGSISDLRNLFPELSSDWQSDDHSNNTLPTDTSHQDTTHHAIDNSRRQKKSQGGFRCEVALCGEVFDRACDLRKHGQRKHLSEYARPLRCNYCIKRFCDSRDLKRHVRSVHNRGIGADEEVDKTRPNTQRLRLCSPLRTVILQPPVATRWRTTVTLIHRPTIPVEAVETTLSRLSLNEVERRYGSCGIDLMKHSTTPAYQNQAELVAIHGQVVLVTPKHLALELSSDFNPTSPFKLRSLVVPKQRQKLEREVQRMMKKADRTISKIILLTDRFQSFDLRVERLQDLLQFLCKEVNLDRHQACVASNQFFLATAPQTADWIMRHLWDCLPWLSLPRHGLYVGSVLGYFCETAKQAGLEPEVSIHRRWFCCASGESRREIGHSRIPGSRLMLVGVFLRKKPNKREPPKPAHVLPQCEALYLLVDRAKNRPISICTSSNALLSTHESTEDFTVVMDFNTSMTRLELVWKVAR